MKKLVIAFLLIMEMFTTSIQAADTQGVEDFVNRFYSVVLGRTADTSGLEYWTDKLISGESTGSDIAIGFVFSEEFDEASKDDVTYLNVLYKAFFNRDADAGGLSEWLKELSNGVSREKVLNGFLYSEEFANLCEAYGIKPVPDDANLSTGGEVEDFVKRFYSVVLGREADTAGLADWVNRLNTKVATGADIATGFVFSDEFDEASKDDVIFLEILYKAFFNRDADDAGLKGWLDQLEQGISREKVLDGFLRSQEFINLCENYGILAFTGAPIYRVLEVKNTSLSEYLFDDVDRQEWYVSTTTTFTYDASGKILTVSWVPETGRSAKITYTYNSNGNLSNRDLLYSCGANSHLIYTYDNNGNRLTLDYSDNGGYSFSITYTYDVNGNMLSSISSEGDSHTYTYDNNGNMLTSSEYTVGSRYTYTHMYTYDENGNMLTSIPDESSWGSSYTYTYNAKGDKTSETSTYNETTEYFTYVNIYDEQGHLISVHKDGELVLSQTWGNIN